MLITCQTAEDLGLILYVWKNVCEEAVRRFSMIKAYDQRALLNITSLMFSSNGSSDSIKEH